MNLLRGKQRSSRRGLRVSHFGNTPNYVSKATIGSSTEILRLDFRDCNRCKSLHVSSPHIHYTAVALMQ